jgi:small neutral amino acid transporter SnatA (MarC family)
MRKPKWLDHWIFSVLSAICSAWVGFTTIDYWGVSWIGAFIFVAGLTLFYSAAKTIYDLIRAARKPA